MHKKIEDPQIEDGKKLKMENQQLRLGVDFSPLT